MSSVIRDILPRSGASALRHRYLECNCLHKSQLGANISRPHSLSLASDNEWSPGVNQGGVDLCYPEIDVTSNKQTLRHGALHRDTGTRPDASALEDSLFVAEFFAARCPLRAAFVRDIICKKVDFLGKINFTRGKPAKTGHWTSGTARLSLERYLQEGPCNSIIRCHSIQVGPLLPLVLSLVSSLDAAQVVVSHSMSITLWITDYRKDFQTRECKFNHHSFCLTELYKTHSMHSIKYLLIFRDVLMT